MREFGNIEETQLPGVGVRYDFVTGGGDRLGVIVHQSGKRELLIYDRDDPDASSTSVCLVEEDLLRLGEILGMSLHEQGG